VLISKTVYSISNIYCAPTNAFHPCQLCRNKFRHILYRLSNRTEVQSLISRWSSNADIQDTICLESVIFVNNVNHLMINENKHSKRPKVSLLLNSFIISICIIYTPDILPFLKLTKAPTIIVKRRRLLFRQFWCIIWCLDKLTANDKPIILPTSWPNLKIPVRHLVWQTILVCQTGWMFVRPTKKQF